MDLYHENVIKTFIVIDAVNIIRKDCGLEPLTKEEFDRRQVQKILQQQEVQPSYAIENEDEKSG